MPFTVDPDGAIEGGGLPDKFNGEATDAKISTFTYKGKSRGGVGVGLLLSLRDTDTGIDLEEPVFYSAGRQEEWEPTPDGRGLVPLKGQEGLRNNCNLFWFLQKLKVAENGYHFKENDFSKLIGMVAYYMRVPGPERSGLQRVAEEGVAARADTVLVPTRVLVPPGGKKSSGRAPAAAATAPAAAATSPGSDGKQATDVGTKLHDWIAGKLTEAQIAGQPGVKRSTLITVMAVEFCKPNDVGISAAAKVMKDLTSVAALGFTVDAKTDLITGVVG